MIDACAERDLGAIFRLARNDPGFTLSKLARLCEMTPSRVGDYVKGRARVRQQHVVERVSHGLRIPGEMLGLAPQPWEGDEDIAGDRPARARTRSDAGFPGPAEGGRPEHHFGDAVQLSLDVHLDIDPKGNARLTYRQVVLNLTNRPLTRMVREIWFEHSRGRLTITPTDACDHQVAIQRLYETSGLAKFVCQISPPVPPGKTAIIEYVCEGGMFVGPMYWLQAIARHTRRFSLTVTQHGATEFHGCTAVEQHPDGSENSVAQHTRWQLDEDRLRLTLHREDLHGNQFLTLRWDAGRGGA
ncbi:helix-turn-helix domain-containing protein [Embleya sp. NBC_00896]|nr:helix-turn-helix domain-containing protein [Embleya sp. NBC_00896]